MSLVRAMEWTDYLVLYEDNEGLVSGLHPDMYAMFDNVLTTSVLSFRKSRKYGFHTLRHSNKLSPCAIGLEFSKHCQTFLTCLFLYSGDCLNRRNIVIVFISQVRLQELLKYPSHTKTKNVKVTIRQLLPGPGNDYRYVYCL